MLPLNPSDNSLLMQCQTQDMDFAMVFNFFVNSKVFTHWMKTLMVEKTLKSCKEGITSTLSNLSFTDSGYN